MKDICGSDRERMDWGWRKDILELIGEKQGENWERRQKEWDHLQKIFVNFWINRSASAESQGEVGQSICVIPLRSRKEMIRKKQILRPSLRSVSLVTSGQ